MKKQIVTALAIAALAATVSPFAMAQNVAIVNGKAVPKTRVEALKQQLERAGRPVSAEMQEQLVKEVIAREVFIQEAQRRGLDTSEDYKNQIELARQSILIRDLFDEFRKTNAATDAEIQAEYDQFVAANSGKEYRARHILVETEAQATAAIAKIKKGAKFEDLAKKLSKDPGSGAKGGDLDWANPSNFVKEFADALIALSKGKMTDTPVKTQFGFHIIRLDDTREAKLPALEEVKTQVAQQLMQQKLQKFQKELQDKAKVE